jgi:release factor glutamine methyltransferase
MGVIIINQKSFNFNNIEIKLHPNVYDPAEDSFQMIESIKININDKVFEIGTGCGLIALFCANLGSKVICSDINPYSVKLVKQNYEDNKSKLKGSLEVRYGDLFSVLKKNEKFDAIIFNPPYLPIIEKDFLSKQDWIDIATNGGIDGLKLIKRYVLNVSKYLKKNGHAYFIFSSLCDRDKLNIYLNKSGLKSCIVSSGKFDDEKIDVYSLSIIE